MSVDSAEDIQVGSQFEVMMGWRLGDARQPRAWARFVVEVKIIDHAIDRLLCEMVEIVSLRTSEPPDNVNQDLLARIKGLPGRYAYLPREAAQGAPLQLKVSTLTGEHSYFFDELPDSSVGQGEG